MQVGEEIPIHGEEVEGGCGVIGLKLEPCLESKFFDNYEKMFLVLCIVH